MRTDLGKNVDRFVYLWIGWYFMCDKSRPCIGRDTRIDDVEKIEWEPVSCHVLSRVGPPKETNIRVCIFLKV